jgi:HK97 family phage major capsid protein
MVAVNGSQLREAQTRKNAVVKCMREILDSGDNLTEAQEKDYAAYEGELESLNAKIAREEKLVEAERTMAAVPDRNRDTQQEANDRIGKIEDNQMKDPMKGFKSPRDFFGSVIKARHGNVDSRLKPLQSAAGSDEHSTQDDAYGGFLVPEAMLPEMLKTDPEPDPMLGRLTNIPMNAPIVNINARVDKNHSSSVSGGLTVARNMETQSTSSSRMQFEKVKLEAYSLFGLTYATEELLSDSPMTIAALLQNGFRDEFTSHMINERLNGTGTGEHMVIMNSPALVSVAKETSQTADTIVIDNIIKMRSRCWGYNNAVWLANHDCVPQLFQLNLASGSAGAIFYQPSLQADMPDMLLGRPIYYTEYCKTIGDKGDIVLGNWTQYLEGLYQPLQSAESVHVRFLNNERAFRLSLRNAGAPWWRTALTPKNSSNTLSPFVVLDARG